MKDPYVIIGILVAIIIVIVLGFGILITSTFFIIVYWQLTALRDISQKEISDEYITYFEIIDEIESLEELSNNTKIEREFFLSTVKDLKVRKDGRFNERSEIGKKANEKVDEYDSEINHYESKIDILNQNKQHLISSKARRIVDKYIFLTYICTLLFFITFSNIFEFTFTNYINNFIQKYTWNPAKILSSMLIDRIYFQMLISFIIVSIYRIILKSRIEEDIKNNFERAE
ncbi:hypothetical protein [Aliarcobacter cryaerophilus]|uniref:hypothetical protein n=1 Tax=Aliarcobacter cryaerophilus TaxID=28198 RepID=UPI0021B61F17|nr:hypothetical protein [Aliarcobacter cryaerophilus]MCT7518985.1 hypothetical protein [Aliarcobacter cryaerophilus]